MTKSNKENMNIGGSLENIVAQYDQQFMVTLPKLYKKKAEREIIETIVVPHFRSELAKVLTDFQAQRKDPELPILPSEVPAICEAVDAMIEANKVPLLVDEYFEKGLARINKMREEAKEQINEVFYTHCREVFAEKRITSRRTLLQKKTRWFKSQIFSSGKRGVAFISAILGENIKYITLENLNDVAELLQLPDIDDDTLEEERQKQRDALAKHGVISRRILIEKGPKWFRKQTFPPYGKAFTFINAILGEPVTHLSNDILDRVADILQLPEVSKEERQEQRNALALHGITDQRSLLNRPISWFLKQIFIPYGKAQALVRAILGRSVKKIDKYILNEIADILELPEVDERALKEERKKQRTALGLPNRRILIEKGPKWFKKQTFPPYGKAFKFAGAILGCPIENLTLEILNEIADILELPD